MGNCEVCLPPEEPALSTARLEDAVRSGDVAEVKDLLSRGVCVNSPIDDEGHTVLDAFLVEHASLLQGALSPKGFDRRCDADELTSQVERQQVAAQQMFKLLRRHGATVSYSSDIPVRPSEAPNETGLSASQHTWKSLRS
mmetsp:Transcript_39530/g.113776  ORF Transcript_39530/g.113776 Transcript_39530/m.113776 type:complete len:140 (-) Transcript_39530:27-446(-)